MKKLLIIGLLVSSTLANDFIKGICAVELDKARVMLQDANLVLSSLGTIEEMTVAVGEEAKDYFKTMLDLTQAQRAYSQAVIKMCKGVSR